MSRIPALSVRDLAVSFAAGEDALPAVGGVSFDLFGGEVLAIVGESGSGKTVTAETIVGLTGGPNVSISGSVRLGTEELIEAEPKALRAVRGNRVAMIFQEPMSSLNPVLRIGTQIVEAIRAHRPELGKAEARRLAIEALDSVGIAEPQARIHSYPHEFSGGMRQRAMIAMALVLEPEVLIADEPTTALDVTVQAQILDLIRRLSRERCLATLLITHDLGVVAEMADRVAVMYGGRVVEEGDLDQIFYDPQHPYTWGLLGSVARLDRPRERRLAQIAGAPPSPAQLPSGCAFAPRCPHAFDRCAELPVLAARLDDSPQHLDRCWLEPETKRGRRQAEGEFGLEDPAR